MKKILLLLVLCLNISIVLGQEYKAWEKHDIEGIYIMAKSKDEAKNYNNVLREGADYYIPTEQEDQVLFIRVSKRITPKLYKLKDGEMYILFSFPPFLFEFFGDAVWRLDAAGHIANDLAVALFRQVSIDQS